MKMKNIVLPAFKVMLVIFLAVFFAQIAFADAPGDILYKGNLGGKLFKTLSGTDLDVLYDYMPEFWGDPPFPSPVLGADKSLLLKPDGDFIVVGSANSFGSGDFNDLVTKGLYDSIMGEFNYDSLGDKFDVGQVTNFGGPANSFYLGVKSTSDGGYVAVGASVAASFGFEDWAGIWPRGSYGTGTDRDDTDSIIIKYDSQFNVEWRKNFGGVDFDVFNAVLPVSDGGYVVVGYCNEYSINNMGGMHDYDDWDDGFAKGVSDGVIVKFDANGNWVWRNTFGGAGWDYFVSLAPASDGGIVAVGTSPDNSFDPDSIGGDGFWTVDGDWMGVTGKGGIDAIIAKFAASDGTVVWQNFFGGSGDDSFNSIIPTSDGGFIAVGTSDESSFGTGDWSDVEEGNGGTDAIIVKYDSSGTVVWKNNFGGSGADNFGSVAPTFDGGFVAVGSSASDSFGNGDWASTVTKGGTDAIAVKYDASGNMVWKKNFGGTYTDAAYSVAVKDNGDIVITGNADGDSFGTGDWDDLDYKGDEAIFYVILRDLIIHKVEFMTYSNNDDVVFQTEMVFDGGTVIESNVPDPDRIGFFFIDWYAINTNGLDAGLQVPFDFDTPIYEDIRVWAKWTPVPDTITLNWYDGISNNSRNIRTFDTWIVDLTAVPTNADGNFQYWLISTGTKTNEKFCYDRVVSFSITESMDLTAVYAPTPAPDPGIIMLIDDESMEKDYGVAGKVNVSFFGDMVIPDSIPLVDKGFIGSYYAAGHASYDWNEDNFKIGAPKVTKVPVPGPTRKSQATFKNVTSSWQYASRAYITYVDTDSTQKTIYSNIIIRSPQP